MEGNIVTVERVVPAPAETIFNVLADPAQHPRIDGSGSVRELPSASPERLSLGARFGMHMKAGWRYQMVNTVVEFDEPRRIAWQPRPPGPVGRFLGGHTWRYELEPVPEGTLVRETWDVSAHPLRTLLTLGKQPEKTRRNMEQTLERLEELVGRGGGLATSDGGNQGDAAQDDDVMINSDANDSEP